MTKTAAKHEEAGPHTQHKVKMEKELNGDPTERE